MNRANISCRSFARGLRMSASQHSGEWGSGAGQGGGAGGSIREAGGSFGRKEAAQEEQYFRKLQAEQLKNMKSSVADEIAFHRQKINEHQEALKKAEAQLSDIEKK